MLGISVTEGKKREKSAEVNWGFKHKMQTKLENKFNPSKLGIKEKSTSGIKVKPK